MIEGSIIRFALCTACGGVKSNTLSHACQCNVVQPSPVGASAGDTNTLASRAAESPAPAAGDHALDGEPAFSCENGDACRHIPHVALTPQEARAVLVAIDSLAELCPEEIQRADAILVAGHFVPALTKLKVLAEGGRAIAARGNE